MLTPMMQQYYAIKSRYKDCLLFFRMGDFFELFDQDAHEVSQKLGLTLTKRSTKEPIAMCGVPVHSHETYLGKLLKLGYSVAICDQLEAASKGKTLVKRDVVRIVTPATVLEDSLLPNKGYNFLVVLGSDLGLCGVDCSTGFVFVEKLNAEKILSTLQFLNPTELLVAQNIWHHFKAELASYNCKILATETFQHKNYKKIIEDYYQIDCISTFGDLEDAQITALGVLLEYLTNCYALLKLRHPKKLQQENFLQLDFHTRRSLELMQTVWGDSKNSLIWAIDRTVTSAGARLLRWRMNSPWADRQKIIYHQEHVQYFYEKNCEKLRRLLTKVGDLARSLLRITSDKGRPNDLGIIRDNIKYLNEIRELSAGLNWQWPDVAMLGDILNNSLKEELPLWARDGNFIKDGFDEELDNLRQLKDHGHELLLSLQERYIAESKVNSLRLKSNQILGYYLEINVKHRNDMPSNFIYRQQISNSLRYTTTELLELEQDLKNSEQNLQQKEISIFQELCAKVLEYHDGLQTIADFLAELDVASSLAYLAQSENYIRPKIVDSPCFYVEGARHSVVEQALKRQGQSFVANDCCLDENNVWLLTGANMTGKSTFLRQNALILILAQMGSFIPASKATLGVFSKIFTRIGAADDLAAGKSTFMVEMIEAASILNQADEKSFVIFDEIGRGTSTQDGLALAQSILEYMLETVKAKCLFATHYHELTKIPNVAKYTMAIREWGDNIVFLHNIIPGNAQGSYGLKVAQMAGLPDAVIKRASDLLLTFSQNSAT